MPSNDMRDYERCFEKRLLRSLDDFQPEWLTTSRQKFTASAKARRFPGLTVIARPNLASPACAKMKGIQRRIQSVLADAGMADAFAFLDADSFHMTVCDIEPTSFDDVTDVPPNVLAARTQQVREAFIKIGAPGRICVRIEDLGLTSTITLSVRFSDDAELAKVRAIEKTIKATTGVDNRDFCGHISLAYWANEPANFRQLLAILKQIEGEMGVIETEFDRIDYTYFPDMNSFIPIWSKDLQTGAIYAGCPLIHLP